MKKAKAAQTRLLPMPGLASLALSKRKSTKSKSLASSWPGVPQNNIEIRSS